MPTMNLIRCAGEIRHRGVPEGVRERVPKKPGTRGACLFSWIAFLLFFSLPGFSVPAELAAPRSDLRAVPLPGTREWEDPVRLQLESAEKELRSTVFRAGVSDYEMSEAYGVAGRVYHGYGLAASAEACYLNASRLRPLNFSWAYLLGRLYDSQGNTNQALTWYVRSTLIRQDYPAVFVYLGRILLGRGQVDAGRRAFEQAEEVSPGMGATRQGLGEVALAMEKYSIAVEKLRSALEISPKSNRIEGLLARAYEGLGELEKAREHGARSGDIDAPIPDPLMEALVEVTRGEKGSPFRGRRALEAKEFSVAVEELQRAVEAHPDSARIRIDLGSALAGSGRYAEASAQFEEALRLDPGNLEALYDMGSVSAVRGDHEEAIRYFKQVLARTPADTDVRLLLARALRNSGRYREAITHYDLASGTRPDDEAAVLEEATLLVDLAMYRDAIRKLREAHERMPDRGRLAHSLARLLAASPDRELRDGALALDLSMRVYRAQPTVAHAETVALALAELGRCVEAAEWQSGAVKDAVGDGNAELENGMRRQLELYRSGPPCRP